MFCSYQGHIGAYLVLGGVDSTGPHLFTVHAHGSTDKLPYVSMGEGKTEMGVERKGGRLVLVVFLLSRFWFIGCNGCV